MREADRLKGSAVVTGATGMIGRALVRLLLEKGHRVHAVVRPGTKRLDALDQARNLLIHSVDLSDLPALTSSIEDECSFFFHLGWAGSTARGRDDVRVQCSNISSSLAAVETASELGCEVFVGAGSQAEWGRVDTGCLDSDTPAFPETAYGQAKLCAGQLTRLRASQLGIRHEWARIVSVYGPGDGAGTLVSYVIGSLLDGKKPSLTGCEQMWDYLYVDDAARALLGMARSGRLGRTYTVGSGTAKPLSWYVETMRDRIDESLPVGIGEVPYSDRQVMRLCANTQAMQQDFGFEPTVEFEEGIERTIQWMRQTRGDR
ncbi:NAD-dependent epimerase/dehydratase family protein [Eggerthella timonensis]|uniref:NAD-dependent epimerase/dehydratase family protein n=1 Tax=Eggerthella timonensis TaxID=1871008 RepID=UPI000C765098|nr:NAD-dependent epimerase/dehydratase family protein [Eggerthella timonensis]